MSTITWQTRKGVQWTSQPLYPNVKVGTWNPIMRFCPHGKPHPEDMTPYHKPDFCLQGCVISSTTKYVEAKEPSK